jgi:hypothetical protein
MKNRYTAVIILGLILTAALAPDVYSQPVSAAGAGGGLITQIISWFTSNILGGIIQVGIMGVGVAMLFMHFRLSIVGFVVVGGLIATHYAEIAGLL